jgi:hypothetical protein
MTGRLDPSNIAPSPGIPNAQAVNPAPDAPGPYMKDGARDFYLEAYLNEMHDVWLADADSLLR